jgi:hypothetical protein
MHEEAYGKMAMKKMQVYKGHKCCCDDCAIVKTIRAVVDSQL